MRIQLKDHLDRMKKHKAQKEREEGEFQYSGSDDEAQLETDERSGEPSSILQVNQILFSRRLIVCCCADPYDFS